MCKLTVFLALVCLTLSARAATGLEMSIAGDMLYSQGLNQESGADEKLTMRGAEVMFYAPVDFRWDGILSLAAHEERGRTLFEVHELHLSTSKLIPRSSLKVGQFFLSLGRLNRFHRHDWPFESAPKVQRTFFAQEGVFDTGVEYSLLLPFAYTFNLTAGVTSGYRYGHSHTTGGKPRVPTHYMRFSGFVPFRTTSGMDVGINYLGRTDGHKNEVNLLGLDLTAKFKGFKKNRWLLQSELWYKREEDAQGETAREVGLYVYNQFPWGETTDIGFRLDGYKNLSKLSFDGHKINHIFYGGVINATFASSEFAKIRTTLSHEFNREEGRTRDKDTRVGLQFLFILGSHPAHDF